MTFLDDLSRWKSGELGRDELLARHPQGDKNQTERNRRSPTGRTGRRRSLRPPVPIWR